MVNRVVRACYTRSDEVWVTSTHRGDGDPTPIPAGATSEPLRQEAVTVDLPAIFDGQLEGPAAADVVGNVSGANATPVQTRPVHVTDKPTGKSETVRAFKTFSVDIPLSQVDKPEGKAAMQKLNDYARKLAREREEEVEMNIVTAPGKGARATQVDSQVLTEEVGKGVVRRRVLSDPRVPANVQRVTIEASNPNRISV